MRRRRHGLIRRRATEPRRLAAPLALAAGFAALEIGAALTIGRFFAWGRAEALLFLAFRPWLLLALALIVARHRRRARWGAYGLALLLAGTSESLLLLGLGGSPWAEMLRGWIAGAALALLFDLIVQAGRRFGGRWGRPAAVAGGLLLLVAPGALRPYEALAIGPSAAPPPGERPPLLLMTGLPIVWGEGGAFDPASRPAAAYRALGREFEVRAIDYLDPPSLAAAPLLLLAQPRLLEPVELVALDRWVRGGGRVLILADPRLIWPTELPIGDRRRPPPTSLLGPLLAHWGLSLEPPAAPRVETHWVGDGPYRRRLALAAPGRFEAQGRACRVSPAGFAAVCRIGSGAAWLVADADLLHDSLWTLPIARGSERHARTADNPLLVAAWLDRLAGRERDRADAPVRWASPAADRAAVLALALLPLVAAAAIAAMLRRR